MDDAAGPDWLDLLLFDAIGRPLRDEAVSRLLAGNDTLSFTTEAYCAMYDRVAAETWKHPGRPPGLEWAPGLADRHLAGTGRVVQVQPGLWAARPEKL